MSYIWLILIYFFYDHAFVAITFNSFLVGRWTTIISMESFQMPFCNLRLWLTCTHTSFSFLPFRSDETTILGVVCIYGFMLLFCRDLSGNSLSGQLPPSVGTLSSLTTLYVFLLVGMIIREILGNETTFLAMRNECFPLSRHWIEVQISP